MGNFDTWNILKKITITNAKTGVPPYKCFVKKYVSGNYYIAQGTDVRRKPDNWFYNVTSFHRQKNIYS